MATDSSQAEQQYRGIAAQAWTGMLIVPIAARTIDFWELVIRGSDQTARPNDPLIGVWFFTIATAASALLAVAIRAFESRPFRRLTFLASAFYLIALVLIQTIDLTLGIQWSGFHAILVITHDVLALWACLASRRWLHAPPVGAA